MKSFFACVLLLALCLPAAAADRRMFPMNVPAAGVRTLHFDVQEGDFVVRGDPSVKEVQMRVAIDRYWLFKLGEEGILKKLIKVTGEGTPELTIATDIPRSVASFGRAEYPVDFEIVVPAGAALEVHDTSGVIVISGMQSSVGVDDSSGTLTVRDVSGPLRVKKDSGDITIEDVSGATTISSHSGQMKLRRVGELTIEDSDGNVNLLGAASVKIHNRGGNLVLSQVKGSLDVDDESGEIVLSEIGGAATVADTSGGIRASKTGPLQIRDTSGDISVDGAESLKVLAKESGQIKIKNVSGAVDVPREITLKRE